MDRLQAFFLIVSLSLLILIIRLIRNGDLELRYSLLWLLGAIVMVVFSIFPGFLEWGAHLMGFKLASNAILTLALIAFMLINLAQSISLTRAKLAIRRLTQVVGEMGQKKITE